MPTFRDCARLPRNSPCAGRSHGKATSSRVAAPMIAAGLERTRTEGSAEIVVVGNSSDRRRFRFSQDPVNGMSCRHASPSQMRLALTAGDPGEPRIEHASAFSSISDSN